MAATALPSPSRWTVWWTRFAAILLIAGVLCPIVITGPFRGQAQLIWFWDLLDKADSEAAIQLLLPLVAGGVALVVSGATTGRTLAGAVLAIGLGTLVLSTVLSGVMSMGRLPGMRGGMRDEGTVAAIFLLLAGATALAAGNHARKYGPDRTAARILAGIGGCAVVASFLLPVFPPRERPAISLLFESESWSGAMLLVSFFCAVAVAYGTLGAVSLAPGTGPRSGLARVLSFLARLLLLAPLAFPLGMLFEEQVEAAIMSAVAAFKSFAVLYGYLMLTGIGLGSLLSPHD